jgi:hypothetical protein
MKTVILPFSGFYNSLHEYQLDRVIETTLSNDNGEPSELADNFSWALNSWPVIFAGYAEKYTKALALEFSVVSLEFSELISPREYNYSTDRIIATIADNDIAALYKTVMREYKAELIALCNERLTSCDGFISFYAPDYKQWPALREWDCNQLGLLLESYITGEMGGAFDQCAEAGLMESAWGNGELWALIEAQTKSEENAEAKVILDKFYNQEV